MRLDDRANEAKNLRGAICPFGIRNRKNMKNKRKFRKALARITWLLIACVICTSAVLYQRGIFDFSFYIRNHNSPVPPADTTAAITDAPVTEKKPDTKYGEEYALQFVDALRAATNIANVGAGILQGGEAVKFEFADFDTLAAEGYELTYADFDAEGKMQICLINTGIDAPYDRSGYESYEMYFYSEAKDNYTIPEGKRKIIYASQTGVRLYMGYIIVDDGETQTVYDSFGKKLYSEITAYFIPALTRDRNNNPLFIINDYRYNGMYYYLDAEGILSKAITMTRRIIADFILITFPPTVFPITAFISKARW